MRSGKVHLLVAGAALFFSGAMTGGYIVWSQISNAPLAEAANSQYQPTSYAESSGETGAQESAGRAPAVQSTPAAHSFGTKSGIFMPPRSSNEDSEYTVELPPAVHAGGTKSFFVVEPRKFSGQENTVTKSAPDPKLVPPSAISIGTKSAPMFVPKNSTAHTTPSKGLPVPEFSKDKDGWRKSKVRAPEFEEPLKGNEPSVPKVKYK